MDTQAAQKQLVGLITQHLSESIPVTRILTYKPDKNGSVTGRFESLNRVFNFVFNGNDVRYKPAMNADSALFSKYYLQRLDATPTTPKGSRTLPKCTAISYSCKGEKGVRCLPLTQNCKIGTDAIGKERLNKIRTLSKSLATSERDTSKLEASQAKIIEQRMALAVENRAKKAPKSLGGKTAIEVKSSPKRAVKDKIAKPKKEKLVKAENESKKVLVKQEELNAANTKTSAKVVQKSPVQVRDMELNSNRDALIKQFGEKLISEAEANIQDIINKNDVLIRVPSEHIDSILAEGKMLNSAEITGRRYSQADEGDWEAEAAIDYQNTRNQFEETILGLPKDTAASKRPIYGYVGNTDDMSAPHQKSVASYGDVAFKLRPEAKKRASVNTADSFDGRPSSKANDFNSGSFAPVNTFKDGARLGENNRSSEIKTQMYEKILNGASESKSIDDILQKTASPYLEYQIQGGVKTSDIAEMHFTNGKEPSKNTIEWAKKNGVKIFTYAKS